ncbi:hypothetical protein LJR066_002809 [Acidovorax sp. LjRoot66]|uniref:hypothetical protein n=1 Tax=Acidovorax sp. LjRoot66 TaxID=3342334 RepID=UPI003ECF3DD4
MTQTQIASLCGVTQQNISSLARGETSDPAYSLGLRLVEMAGTEQTVSVTWLADGGALLNLGYQTMALTCEEVRAIAVVLSRAPFVEAA